MTKLNQASKEEKYVHVFSPRSGRKYRFYYARAVKLFAQVIATSAVVIVGGVFLVNAFLNAFDAEQEGRIERQEEYFEFVEDHQVDSQGGAQ